MNITATQNWSYYLSSPLPLRLRLAICEDFISFFRRNDKGIIVSRKNATINIDIPF